LIKVKKHPRTSYIYMSDNNSANETTFGSGDYTCNIHVGFTTTDVNEWNQHCIETGHVDRIDATPCVICSKEIGPIEVPFQPVKALATGITKDIKLVCQDCMNNYRMNAPVQGGQKQ
jgi:hypothetical protein